MDLERRSGKCHHGASQGRRGRGKWACIIPEWQEQPLACAMVPLAGNGDQVTKQEILDFLATRIAKWWLPDDVVFIEAVPKTSVGKFNKRALKERFKDYKLPALA